MSVKRQVYLHTCREIYVGHSSKEYTYMIIGVVHKDRELTISRLWSFNCIPDRNNRNDPEMNDFFSLHPKVSQS